MVSYFEKVSLGNPSFLYIKCDIMIQVEQYYCSHVADLSRGLCGLGNRSCVVTALSLGWDVAHLVLWWHAPVMPAGSDTASLKAVWQFQNKVWCEPEA